MINQVRARFQALQNDPLMQTNATTPAAIRQQSRSLTEDLARLKAQITNKQSDITAKSQQKTNLTTQKTSLESKEKEISNIVEKNQKIQQTLEDYLSDFHDEAQFQDIDLNTLGNENPTIN